MCYPDPRYLGDTGEISALLRQAQQGPDLATRAGAYHYLAKGAATEERFGLYRVDMRPQVPGANPHFHRTFSESFFVLSGTVSLFNGDRWTEAKEGDFLYVPEGGIHAFRNDSENPASLLLIFAPGVPREEYFETLAKMAAGTQLSEEEFATLCIRHDNYLIDPKSQALYKKLLSGK